MYVRMQQFENNLNGLKSDKGHRHITWRPECVCAQMS